MANVVKPAKRYSWPAWRPCYRVSVIEPVYPKAGHGRRPYPLDTMLRVHCMQQWYNLSDGAMEDALYEIASMRLFATLSLDQAIPDRTTIMNFRHLLEQHPLARQLFESVNQWLSDAGIMMKQGTQVMPPSATKNKRGERDPEMHQTKKGNQWYFGMKTHISVDAKVEHPFRLIKRQFGFVKARYKGLHKNDNPLAILFTLANLFRMDQMIRAWDSGAQNTK